MQDGAVRGGPILDSDWAAHPPTELWRTTVGPAWSSFVSVNNSLFTQEQRSDEEAVVCYDNVLGQSLLALLSDTGEQFWDMTASTYLPVIFFG